MHTCSSLGPWGQWSVIISVKGLTNLQHFAETLLSNLFQALCIFVSCDKCWRGHWQISSSKCIRGLSYKIHKKPGWFSYSVSKIKWEGRGCLQSETVLLFNFSRWDPSLLPVKIQNKPTKRFTLLTYQELLITTLHSAPETKNFHAFPTVVALRLSGRAVVVGASEAEPSVILFSLLSVCVHANDIVNKVGLKETVGLWNWIRPFPPPPSTCLLWFNAMKSHLSSIGTI